jgi:hypothetical protein
MALETNFDAGDDLFVGEDKHLIIGGGPNVDGNSYHVLEHPGSGSSAVVNVAAFAMEFAIRTELDDASPVFTVVTGGDITVTGVYNVAQGSNTQAVDVFITDTNSLLLLPEFAAGEVTKTFYWALKRTDAGLETVIAHGTMVWKLAATR